MSDSSVEKETPNKEKAANLEATNCDELFGN